MPRTMLAAAHSTAPPLEPIAEFVHAELTRARTARQRERTMRGHLAATLADLARDIATVAQESGLSAQIALDLPTKVPHATWVIRTFPRGQGDGVVTIQLRVGERWGIDAGDRFDLWPEAPASEPAPRRLLIAAAQRMPDLAAALARQAEDLQATTAAAQKELARVTKR